MLRFKIVRGQYGHGSPSTNTSHANRTRFGCQGTGVKLVGSGIAAMSGSCGPCPSSPVAKPANPAPSANTSSRCAAGTSFAFGLPYISTNCAKRNSIPILSTSFLTSSTDCGASAIPTSFRSVGPPDPPELDHFRCDRKREPVPPPQVDAGHALDPLQALPQGVGVDEERSRGGNHVPPVIEVRVERVEELRASAGVVRSEFLDPVLR